MPNFGFKKDRVLPFMKEPIGLRPSRKRQLKHKFWLLGIVALYVIVLFIRTYLERTHAKIHGPFGLGDENIGDWHLELRGQPTQNHRV
jgi:hypothetical protein